MIHFGEADLLPCATKFDFSRVVEAVNCVLTGICDVDLDDVTIDFKVGRSSRSERGALGLGRM